MGMVKARERKKTDILIDKNMRKKTLILKEEKEEKEREVLKLIKEKYLIKRLLTDNSGEADIYIAEYENKEYIVKLYRSSYKYDEVKNSKIKSIKSPGVIKIVEEGEYKNRFYEVMPYYENGDLSKYKLDRSFIKNVLVKSLNEALKEIHEKKIVHRDIKPSNIFLSSDKKNVVLGDFGISSLLDEKVTSKKTSKAKTLEYSAIETFNSVVTPASDYYSFGITVMEVLTGKTSYEGLTEEEIIKRKVLNKLNIPLDNNDEFYRLIKGLTSFSAEKRWGCKEVESWLSGEYVSVEEELGDFNRPYKFNDKSINTKMELALELSKNWIEGRKNFERGYLNEHFKKIDQGLACKIEDFLEVAKNNQSFLDREYFKAIHTIYPGTKLIWLEEDLGSVNNIIRIMRKRQINDNVKYCRFVFEGGLAYYLKVNRMAKQKISVIEKIGEISKSFYNRAYYLFLLLDDNIFYYRGKELRNINDLIDFLSENIEDCEEIAKELEKSEYFELWMSKMGKDRIYNKYIKR